MSGMDIEPLTTDSIDSEDEDESDYIASLEGILMVLAWITLFFDAFILIYLIRKFREPENNRLQSWIKLSSVVCVLSWFLLFLSHAVRHTVTFITKNDEQYEPVNFYQAASVLLFYCARLLLYYTFIARLYFTFQGSVYSLPNCVFITYAFLLGWEFLLGFLQAWFWLFVGKKAYFEIGVTGLLAGLTDILVGPSVIYVFAKKLMQLLLLQDKSDRRMSQTGVSSQLQTIKKQTIEGTSLARVIENDPTGPDSGDVTLDTEPKETQMAANFSSSVGSSSVPSVPSISTNSNNNSNPNTLSSGPSGVSSTSPSVGSLQAMSAQLNVQRQRIASVKDQVKKMNIELDPSQENLINTISKQTFLSALAVIIGLIFGGIFILSLVLRGLLDVNDAWAWFPPKLFLYLPAYGDVLCIYFGFAFNHTQYQKHCRKCHNFFQRCIASCAIAKIRQRMQSRVSEEASTKSPNSGAHLL